MAMLIDITGQKSEVPGIGKLPPITNYMATESIIRNLINYNKKWNVYCSITKRLITPENIDEFMNDMCCYNVTPGDVDSSTNGVTSNSIAIDIYGPKKYIPVIENKLPPLLNFVTDVATIRRLIVLPEWRVYASLSGRLITTANIDEILGTYSGGGKNNDNTNIIPNPTGGLSSTDKLESIKINDVVYKIIDNNAIDSKLSEIESEFTDIDDKFNTVNTNFTEIDNKFNTVDTKFTEIESEFTDNDSRLTEIEQAIADINYHEINIDSFINNQSVVELGSTISSVTLNWTLNKNPKTQSLDGVTVGNDIRSKTITGLTITTTTSFVLTVTDERDYSTSRTTQIQFVNGIYYGATTSPTTYDDDFVKSLTKSLQTSRNKSFTVNALSNQYIYYILPTRYGTPKFNIGGFDGGFVKQTTLSFTNASGYSENYDIWRSDNIELGSTTVNVT